MQKPFVLYDDQIFSYQTFGGISRYFCEIIKNIQVKYDISIRYSNNYYLIENNLAKHRIPIPKSIFDRYQDSFTRKNTRFSRKKLSIHTPYLFHPTYYDPYFLDYIGNNPFVITVHDMIYEKFPQCFTNPEIIINQKREVITKANRIIAISEHTKKDIIDLLNIAPDKIDVIYHGTNMMKPQKLRLNLPRKYLLFVGDRWSYKNFERFILAFAKLANDDKELFAICTGRPFTNAEIALFKQLNIADRMMLFRASDLAMSELYSRAELFVFPSLYEGFGIPILEAFANNCPVALSHASCFPEIAGEAGAYFDPYSVDSIIDTVKKIIYNKSEQQKLIYAGKKQLELYSWNKAARETEETYKRVLF